MSNRRSKAPHPRQAGRPRTRQCEECQKRSYGKRKTAATAAAMLRANCGEAVSHYRCPAGNGWHIGHTPRAAGRATILARMRRAGLEPADTYRGRPVR